MKVSGFTFIHNALESGYPLAEAVSAVLAYVDEVIVVDMQSTDGTAQLIEAMDNSVDVPIKRVEGTWTPGAAGTCLAENHSMHVTACKHDLIWHFEADEVFGPDLSAQVDKAIQYHGMLNVCVHRIQVEQNFQRARWWAEPVHRVFQKGKAHKQGQTTIEHKEGEHLPTLGPDSGILWDITNCFRDQYKARYAKQAELWGHQEPQYRFAGIHAGFPPQLHWSEDEVDAYLQLPLWTWKVSPFFLPSSLRVLVGHTQYNPIRIS